MARWSSGLRLRPLTPATRVRISYGSPNFLGINGPKAVYNIVVGVDGVEGPPVPIPNTVVKLNSAEDTWWEAAWENRAMPTQNALIAQSVEHSAVNRVVVGSSPT